MGEQNHSQDGDREVVVLFSVGLLPLELRIPTTRYGLFTPKRNEEEIGHDLVISEESREATLVRMTSQQQIVAWSFKKRVKAKTFKVGD